MKFATLRLRLFHRVNGEADTWLDYALDCKYLSAGDHSRLAEENRAVGSMLGAMLNNPHPFLTKY